MLINCSNILLVLSGRGLKFCRQKSIFLRRIYIYYKGSLDDSVTLPEYHRHASGTIKGTSAVGANPQVLHRGASPNRTRFQQGMSKHAFQHQIFAGAGAVQGWGESCVFGVMVGGWVGGLGWFGSRASPYPAYPLLFPRA